MKDSRRRVENHPHGGKISRGVYQKRKDKSVTPECIRIGLKMVWAPVWVDESRE